MSDIRLRHTVVEREYEGLKVATAIKNILVSADAYLQAEQIGEIRHEYANGFVYVQAGASRNHNLIALNLASLLRAHLKGGPCRVYIADMKVRIKTLDLDLFYYPDVMVSCETVPPSHYYEGKPKLIVEVLSDTTRSKDHLEKLNAYSKIPSLLEYILIEQDSIFISIYRRTPTSFDVETLETGDSLQLQSLGIDVPVSEIYADIPGL